MACRHELHALRFARRLVFEGVLFMRWISRNRGAVVARVAAACGLMLLVAMLLGNFRISTAADQAGGVEKAEAKKDDVKKPAPRPDSPEIPHAQEKPVGPPLSPQEAIKKMVVPEGFTVELVASEPDIVNPVAMTIDERGRFWITESLEYPRHSAGPGQDRVKILEDTQGNGKIDKITVFTEGLNIPSGVAVGYGGVWVANAPDILFYSDMDHNDQADKQEVVATGFGRADTHELPNSLTWGPDGWLYGWNGVFNPSHVKQGGKQFDFTCALFRIHPKTHEFELFCEGTSNPWAIAFDPQGNAFCSACVIDHLWHLTETGYYHRQGGAYPPYTWELGSIVKHKHQQAAYCGLLYLDSDSFPIKYCDKLLMGNIHGGALNIDSLRRNGATYTAESESDFLTANDAWFMPVAQKIGPDGSLYVLDWYDKYHCYQDANRDAAGIDREHGRLYRIRYKDTPHTRPFNLGKESDQQLIARLSSANIYFRETAQRLLTERDKAETRPLLEKLVLDDSAPHKARMHALWVLVSSGRLDAAFHQKLLAHADASLRAWGVRAAGNFKKVDPPIRTRIAAMATDSSPDVLVQVAIAARKIEGLDAVDLLTSVVIAGGNDPLIPHIVWQNLQPLLDDHADQFLELVKRVDLKTTPGLAAMMPQVAKRLLVRKPK